MPVVLIPLARTAPRLAERFGINRVVLVPPQRVMMS